jgi:hypothetical protein
MSWYGTRLESSSCTTGREREIQQISNKHPNLFLFIILNIAIQRQHQQPAGRGREPAANLPLRRPGGRRHPRLRPRPPRPRRSHQVTARLPPRSLPLRVLSSSSAVADARVLAGMGRSSCSVATTRRRCSSPPARSPPSSCWYRIQSLHSLLHFSNPALQGLVATHLDVSFQFAEGQGVLLNVNTRNQIEASFLVQILQSVSYTLSCQSGMRRVCRFGTSTRRSCVMCTRLRRKSLQSLCYRRASTCE